MALLDSPSLSGAYRITLTPGEQTEAEVEAELFARSDVAKLGVAPLTSMFTFGEATAQRPDDFRPQVHDSDGLLVHTGQDEWIWRPLQNPSALRISAFMDHDPQGFGLMQRERHFDRYLDLEAHYHRRPSQWVEPIGDWREGHVELVEIPTPDETHDNIVAYWVADAPLKAGESRTLHYRTYTLNTQPEQHTLGRVIRTRQGSAAVPGEVDSASADQRQLVVDFMGGPWKRWPRMSYQSWTSAYWTVKPSFPGEAATRPWLAGHLPFALRSPQRYTPASDPRRGATDRELELRMVSRCLVRRLLAPSFPG